MRLNIIDLREIGVLTVECEDYLSKLIAVACSLDDLKYNFSLYAKADFEWCNKRLINYVIAGYIGQNSSRVKFLNFEFISSGEWLNAIFTSGHKLDVDHILITMTYINKNMPFQNIIEDAEYVSGKNTWLDAPTPLKTILDLLDDACLYKYPVKIIVPTVITTDPLAIELLKKYNNLDIEYIRLNSRIEWNSE